MLKPLNLYLDGWLSYDKATIPLDIPGITQLKGVVGSGKSAIYEAFFYLLFGKTLRNKSGVKDLANKILNNGYEIWCTFENNGHWYKIKEIRDRDNSGLWFWKDEEKEDNLILGKTNPETRKLIIKEIGMSDNEFKSISFLGQRQSQILVEGTSGERGKVVTQLYGLEETYDEPIRECEADLKTAIKEKKDLTIKIEELEKDLKNLEESMKVEESIDDVNPEQLQKLEEKKNIIEDKLEKIREKEADIREIIGKYDALKESKDKYNKLNVQIKELEEKITELPKSESTIKELDKSISEYREKQADIKAEINKITSDLRELNEIGELCPIDKKECPEKRPESFRTQRKEGLEGFLTKHNKDIERARECLKTCKEEKEKTENYEDAQKELDNKTNLKEQYSINELPDIDKEKKLLAKCTEGRREGKDKLETVNEEIKSLETLKSLKKQQEEFKAKVERTLQEKKENIEETKKTLEDLSEDAEYLSASVNVLKRLKNYKVDVILDLLNTNLEDQLKEISNYKATFQSQKKDSKGKRFLDSLDIIVYNGAIELPIEMCSGGQLNAVGVAVLLATWKTAFELARKSSNCLWLDEPFEYQDNKVLNDIFERIVQVASETGATNIKIISHRDLDERLIDHVWEIARVDGISNLEIS